MKYLKNAKKTMALGVGSMAGMGAIGAMGGISGMPKNNIAGIAGAGLNLANIGQLGKTGIGIAKDIGKNKKHCKKGISHNVIHKII